MRQPQLCDQLAGKTTCKLDQVGRCHCPLPGLFRPRGPSSGGLSNQGQRAGCWVGSSHNLHSVEPFLGRLKVRASLRKTTSGWAVAGTACSRQHYEPAAHTVVKQRCKQTERRGAQCQVPGSVGKSQKLSLMSAQIMESPEEISQRPFTQPVTPARVLPRNRSQLQQSTSTQSHAVEPASPSQGSGVLSAAQGA